MRLTSSLACLALLAVAANGQTRKASVVVSTNEVTGPLDMGRMAVGQGGLSEEPMWQSRAAEIRAPRPKIVRLFIQEYFNLLPAKGKYNFATLDRSVDLILSTGAKPLMSIDFKPRVLYPKIDRDIVEPNDRGEWERLITAMVKHYKDRGAGIQYWEVANEPDIGEDGGCPLRFKPDNYVTYYKHTAEAVLRGDPQAKVGGPALAYWKSPILPALLEFRANGNAPLHFVSWHIYSSKPEEIRGTIDGVKALLARYPSLRVETMLNEWNLALMKPDAENLIIQPAYLVETIWNMLEAGLDYSCYYHIRDYHVEPATFAKFFSKHGVAFMAGWWNRMPQYHGLFDFQDEVRPAYFAFKLLSRVTGQRLKVETGGVHAIAAHDELYESKNVLVWNFSNEPLRTAIEFRGLAKAAKINRVKLDARAPMPDETSRLKFQEPVTLSPESAAACEIGLRNVHASAFDQFAEAPLSGLLLAAGNRRIDRFGHLAVSPVVLRMQDLLNEERAVRIERPDDLNRLLRRPFDEPARIDKQVVALSHGETGCVHELNIAPRVFSIDAPAELHGGEPLVQIALSRRPHRLRRGPEQRARIGADLLVPARAHQHANGLAMELVIAIVPRNALLELVGREVIHQLGEDEAASVHASLSEPAPGRPNGPHNHGWKFKSTNRNGPLIPMTEQGLLAGSGAIAGHY